MSHKDTLEGMRPRLENARHDALALTRTVDLLALTLDDLPPAIQDLFELDADFAEALWALGQPVGAVNFRVVVKDTIAALNSWAPAYQRFVAALDPRTRARLVQRLPAVRATLLTADAYVDVPGGDPRNG